jgi:hypothetical protein
VSHRHRSITTIKFSQASQPFHLFQHRQLGRDFVMVVEGTAPLTATGLYDGPRRVSDVHSYQTRYWGFAAAGPLFLFLVWSAWIG